MTVANTPTLNYTDAMTAELVTAYKAAPNSATIEDFAAKFGKTVKSVVAKLVNEKVYVAKTSVPGAKRMTKAEMLADVAANLGLTTKALESLDKGGLDAIKALHASVLALTANTAVNE